MNQNLFSPSRSSQSTVSNSNKYESREKINAAAQRTLLIDSGSETDSNVYESYAAVRNGRENEERDERRGEKRAVDGICRDTQKAE